MGHWTCQHLTTSRLSNVGMSNVPCQMYLSQDQLTKSLHENQIQLKPQPTPNHSASETNAVSLARDVTSASSLIVTRHLIVNVKARARNSDTIFTQNAKL